MKNNTKLPDPYDLEKFWRDDAQLVAQINDAIELSGQSKWTESEAKLVDAEKDIEEWEPYDHSDVYYKGIWADTISKVRKYNSEKQSENPPDQAI